MSVSVKGGESCCPKKEEITVAVVQPEQTIGPGKDKVDKLGQDEWARIPELYFEKNIFTPQPNERGGALPSSSVNPVIFYCP